MLALTILHLAATHAFYLHALVAGVTGPRSPLAVLALNTGNPNDITDFFKAWSDASKKWMPFLLIFGVVGAYALMTIGHHRGWGHFKDQIVAGFIAMMVIALAPGLFS